MIGRRSRSSGSEHTRSASDHANHALAHLGFSHNDTFARGVAKDAFIPSPASTGTGETHDPRYRDLSPQELRDVLHRQAFFVSTETGKHYTAPLWISEFGEGRHTTDPASRAWFENFVGYLAETDTDFAYWPAVGFHEGGGGNGWVLLSWDTDSRRADVLDGTDWRGPTWRRLVNSPSRTGQIPATERWSMLTLDHADFQASRSVRAMADWNPGARKGACPDGQRLTGLSHTGNRGLCTGALAVPAGYAVVRGETYVDTDWASGYTKVQCPPDHAAVGYSVTGSAFSALLCGRSATPLGRAGRTVWFDRGDNRPSGTPGVAYTGRVGSNRTPDAPLCRA